MSDIGVGVGSEHAKPDPQLLMDWELRMRGDPDAADGWAYHWDDSECSTSQPTDRMDEDHCYATMFLICNHTDDPVHDFVEFCKCLSQDGALKVADKQIQVIMDTDDDSSGDSSGDSSDSSKQAVSVIRKLTGAVLLRGSITLNKSRDGDPTQTQVADPNVGFYAQLQAVTAEGMFLMRVMEMSTPYGYCCIIDHDRVEFDLGDGRMLVKVSGFGPDETDISTSSNSNNGNNELATRFTIRDNGIDVARCHLSYIDGSLDPSMGPTIDMMAVHQDYRGKNILPVLWYWVRCFIEEICTLECMNNDTSAGNVMVKATHLINAEIERKGDDNVPISDKDFFYDYAGFSVREQKGYMLALMGSHIPKDEEAVLFMPLLTKQQVKDRTEYKGAPNIEWPCTKGARACDHCQKVRIGQLRCSNCKNASYCTRNCQKKDWRRHKKWCGKTKDQVHEVLVEQGLRVLQPDGSFASMRGMPAGMGGMR
jgi:hypothetical protein